MRQNAELRDADSVVRGGINFQPAALEILDGVAVLLELLGDRLAEERLLVVPDGEETVRRPVPPLREVERVCRGGPAGFGSGLKEGRLRHRAELRRLSPDDGEFRRVAPPLSDAAVFEPLLLPIGGRFRLIERPTEAVRAAGLLPQGAESGGDRVTRRAGIEGRGGGARREGGSEERDEHQATDQRTNDAVRSGPVHALAPSLPPVLGEAPRVAMIVSVQDRRFMGRGCAKTALPFMRYNERKAALVARGWTANCGRIVGREQAAVVCIHRMPPPSRDGAYE